MANSLRCIFVTVQINDFQRKRDVCAESQEDVFFFSNKTNVNAHKQLRIFLLLRQTVANDTRKKD
jgi:hypothetical protein